MNPNEIQKSENTFQQEESTNTKRTVKIVIGVIILILIIIMLFSTIFAVLNINNTKILDGISINRIDVSNLSKDEATIQLQQQVDKLINENINLYKNEFETFISIENIDVSIDIDKAVNEAYMLGRNGNIIQNNFEILLTMIQKKEIILSIDINKEKLTETINAISKKMPDKLIESSYYIENENLIITKGTSGFVIKEKELSIAIINSIQNLKHTLIEIPVEIQKPKEIDLDTIYNEVYKSPKDAYYTNEGKFKFFPDENGLDFAITLEEAREILKEDKKEFIIPLKIIKASKTSNDIGVEIFPDIISTFNTKYDAKNTSRSTNLKLAADKINGYILLPGATFSYNKVVGERTIAAGYKEAPIYLSGKVVDGLGGGICQISSTLYNTALLANLEIVERTNHGFLTSYLGAGRDATVVYGALDFKFKNTREYPIKIICDVKNGIAKIEFVGIKQDTEYEVVIETAITSTIPFKTVYQDTTSLNVGVEKTVQWGSTGCKSEAYKVLKLNGAVVSKTLLSKDTYNAMQKIISRGTNQI